MFDVMPCALRCHTLRRCCHDAAPGARAADTRHAAYALPADAAAMPRLPLMIIDCLPHDDAHMSPPLRDVDAYAAVTYTTYCFTPVHTIRDTERTRLPYAALRRHRATCQPLITLRLPYAAFRD